MDIKKIDLHFSAKNDTTVPGAWARVPVLMEVVFHCRGELVVPAPGLVEEMGREWGMPLNENGVPVVGAAAEVPDSVRVWLQRQMQVKGPGAKFRVIEWGAPVKVWETGAPAGVVDGGEAAAPAADAGA
jgi:hypothetical protein